jgi:hypothetical protein
VFDSRSVNFGLIQLRDTPAPNIRSTFNMEVCSFTLSEQR